MSNDQDQNINPVSNNQIENDLEKNQSKSKKFYEKTWFIVLMLIVFFPAGLFLMWNNCDWKKPVKVIISIVIALIVVCCVANGGKSEEPNIDSKQTTTHTQSNKQENNTTKQKEPDVPQEYKNALVKAKSYSDNLHMSKKGIYDQLTSEYGEHFPAAAAQYAIDNLQADYNKNALEKAKSYYKDMAMSKQAVYEQLTSEYGEKFTASEAQYAIDNLA